MNYKENIEDKNIIKDLNNENAKLKRDINTNKTLIERLKTEKEKQEKEIKRLNEQLKSKTRMRF